MDLTTQLGDQLDAAALANPCGPAEGPYAEYPMSTLVLHINREMIHHGAESLVSVTFTSTRSKEKTHVCTCLARRRRTWRAA